jgi:hypothetical protein
MSRSSLAWGLGMMRSVEVGVDKQEEHKDTRRKRRGQEKESKRTLKT